MLKKVDFSKPEYYLPSLILILFYLSELTSKILKFNEMTFDRFSGLIKLIFEVLVLVYLFKRKRNNFQALFKIGLFFLLIYSIGHIFILPEFSLVEFVINLYSLNGYLFIFILFYALNPEYSYQENILFVQLSNLEIAIKLIFIVNSIAILLGFFFSISVFQTYLHTSIRFGFNGGFLHASHSSYIYCIFILYFYHLYVKDFTRDAKLFFISSLSIAFFVATKTIFLFNILFLFYLIYRKFSTKGVLAFIMIFSTFIYFMRDYVINVFKNKFGVLYDLYRDQGILTMIFSTRNKSLTKDLIPYLEYKWSWVNFLFGGSNFYAARTEFEVIDLIWFFGFLGGSIYVYLIYSTFIKTFINNLKLRIPSLFFFLCILLAGSFFTNAPVIAYFIILFFQLNYCYLKEEVFN